MSKTAEITQIATGRPAGFESGQAGAPADMPIARSAAEDAGYVRAKWWYLRRFTALSILGLFIVTAYGPREINLLEGNYSGSTLFGAVPFADPIAAAQSAIATGGLYTTAIIGTGIIAGFYFLAGGRSFCGWVCPLGLLLDFAGWLAAKTGFRRPFQGFPSGAKYGVLAVALAVPAVTGVALYEFYNPIAMFHRALLFGGFGAGVVTWLIVATVFMYDFALSRGGWCRTLCPTGAFYSLLGRVSPLQVRMKPGIDPASPALRRIAEICPEPAAMHSILHRTRPTGDCIVCGACIDKAGDSLEFSIGKRL